MVALANVVDRESLKPRRDPYFIMLSRGCAIGFRKMARGAGGTWIARWRDPDTGKQHHRPMGPLDTLPANERFGAAVKAAREWFQHLEAGGSHQSLTIREACERYVEHLRRAKGGTAAQDAEGRFQRYVFSDPKFAAIKLEKLKPGNIASWRARLQDRPTATGTPRTDSALNRDMTCLRSALNLAKADGFIATDSAWKQKLLPIAGADKSRGVYLDPEQRAALIAAAPADLAAFLRAQCLLPVRPGAMAQLKVSDFESRLGTIRVRSDKANAGRVVQLPGATAAFFAEQAANKLPGAWLFARAGGKPWDKDSWKGPFRDAAGAAGLPKAATLYAIRHSAITDLVHAGADLLTVSQIAGTSLLMIQRHYGHLCGAVAATALDALARQMGA